jgi:hypothetical protein
MRSLGKSHHCRTIVAFVGGSAAQHVGGNAGLGRLLGEFSEETLHMVLEALAAVVGADQAAGTRWEPCLSPAVLQLWAQHVKDPLLSMDAVAVIEGLASIPAALPSLQVACQ